MTRAELRREFIQWLSLTQRAGVVIHTEAEAEAFCAGWERGAAAAAAAAAKPTAPPPQDTILQRPDAPDRRREPDGSYARCAFLPYDTLDLQFEPTCPDDLRQAIEADAAALRARRGETYLVSTSDQTVKLGDADTGRTIVHGSKK